jgi:SP family facilitated glucose transporter-like MFS transporter 8
MSDLDLSLAQFSLFGSLSTFGGMIGAIFSAKAASAFGHKMVSINYSQNHPYLSFILS